MTNESTSRAWKDRPAVRLIFLLALTISSVLVGTALATPGSGVTAETARGLAAEDIDLKEKFDNGGKVRLQTRGPIEVATQRVVAEPGATFGWHTHPGPNVNVVLQGTVTLYHDEMCMEGIDYGPGTVFTTSPDEIHLARNLGSETVVIYGTYFVPLESPVVALRIDQPLPAPGCPE
jgi:quercetin dioxygenase-like cupin family protein